MEQARGASPATNHLEPKQPQKPEQLSGSSSSHHLLQRACEEGLHLLDYLAGQGEKDEEGQAHAASPATASQHNSAEPVPRRRGHALLPHFIPRSQALLFLTSYRAALGLGVQHGHGFVVGRLPSPASHLGKGTPACPLWSTPCFVSVNGLQWGLAAGAERTQSLVRHVLPDVGVLTDRALHRLLHGGKLVLSADLNLALGPLGYDHDNPEWFLNADLAVVSVAHGLMFDLSMSGAVVHVDQGRNAECYGAGVSPQDLLEGRVMPPGEVLPLLERIREVQCSALAAAFDTSHASTQAESGEPWC